MIIDDMSNDSCIADAFVQSYKRLFTSVPYDKSDMQALIHENCDHLARLGYNEDYVVKIDKVRQAVSQLKAFKGDGNSELSSDHFLHASNDLYCHIALLLSAMVVNGYCPEQLTTSSVIPIPKGCNVNQTDSRVSL